MLIGQLSDTHLLSDPSVWVWGRNPAANLAAVMTALPPVDAIVVTGDIAEDGSVDAYRLADALTERDATRRYFIAGNHDDPDAMRAVFGEVEEFRLVDLSDHWSLGLLNSQWIGHDAGYVTDSTLDRIQTVLDRIDSHVVLCLHHPPLSPCTKPDCGLSASDRLLRVLRGSAVRVVLSGHVHQAFDTACDGIRFLGAPSTFRQLRHGGDPHYSDTGEPSAAQLLELHDDGGVEHRAIVAGDERRSVAPDLPISSLDRTPPPGSGSV